MPRLPPPGGSLLGATRCPLALWGTQVPSLMLSPSCPRVGGACPCRVSSVLNRDVKQFGKKHMFDTSEETCWNSDQVGARGQGKPEGWDGSRAWDKSCVRGTGAVHTVDTPLSPP